MGVDSAFVLVLVVSIPGLLLSVLIKRFMVPRPSLNRPWAAWLLHGGIWLLAYGVLVLVLGRPWYAAVNVSVFLLIVVMVNNTKMKTLRESFVFQDFEYITNAIRHPRLYIPFLGWGKFIAAVAGGALAVYIGLWGEAVPVNRFAWSGQLGGILVVTGLGVLLLFSASIKTLSVTLEPDRDIRAFGLLATLWNYAKAIRSPPVAESPFRALVLEHSVDRLPHLVAVQSESFFDPRSLYPGIRNDVLAHFDQLKNNAVAHGKLKVPAWGANTVRTEFSFLSGLDSDSLGVHRFNPYRAITAGWDVLTLASFLKCSGYHTVCIHPYPASFYRRDRVYPRLGFDQFIDIHGFHGAECFGPYIGDVAVTDKIAAVLHKAVTPVFVFAITMENHGPLHLERVEPSDIEDFYSRSPPDGCDDLTIYLRHLRNADRMIASLREMLEQSERTAGLCWYGDHVPIMPAVYKTLGTPMDVEYLFWTNKKGGYSEARDSHAHSLALEWLQHFGMVRDDEARALFST